MTNMIKLRLKDSHGSLKATLERSRPVYKGTKTSAKEISEEGDGVTWEWDSTCIRTRRAGGMCRRWSISSQDGCSETIASVPVVDGDGLWLEGLAIAKVNRLLNHPHDKRIYPSPAPLNGSSWRRDEQNENFFSFLSLSLSTILFTTRVRKRGFYSFW